MASDEAKRIAHKKAKVVAKEVFSKILSNSGYGPATHGVTGISGFLAFLLVVILPLISALTDLHGPVGSFMLSVSENLFGVMFVGLIWIGVDIFVWYLLFLLIYTYKYANVRGGFSDPIDDCCRTFYTACKEAGIVKPLTPAMAEKMKKIAAVQEIEGDADQLLKKYERGYDVTENDTKKRLDAVKEKEWKEKEELDQFVGLSGTEKRRKMILAKMPKKQYYTGSANSFYKKESDWAIAGGIASGLAGGAAGVAAALDTQAKNASVRSYNQSISSTVNMLNSMEYNSVRDNNERREALQKNLERIPLLLTENVPDQTVLMRNIETSCKIETTETGTVKLEVKMKLKKPVKIMNETEAVVDGYLDAVITDKAGHSDTVPVTLPMYGISTWTSTEKAMSVNFTNPDASQYSVRFQPKNLWLIER